MAKLSKTIFLIILFFGLFGLAKNSEAATYYVSNTGSGSTCSIGSPCSASYAFANAVAGDTWLFRGGTYTFPASVGYEYGPYNVANSGTSDSNRIIFQAYPGESPVFMGSHDTSDSAKLLTNGGNSYITIDGFRFEAFRGGTRLAAQLGLYSDGSTNDTKRIYVTIKNCTFIGTEVFIQDNHALLHLAEVGNVLIKGNTFIGLVAHAGNTDYHGVAAVESYGAYTAAWANNVIIENNNFDNCSVGVYTKFGASDFTVRYNWFKDVEAGVIFGPGGVTPGFATQSNHKVYHNVIKLKHLTSNTERILSGTAAGTRPENPATGHEYHNNTIYSDDTVADASTGISGTDVTNIESYNNIIVLGIYVPSYSSGFVNWRYSNSAYLSFKSFDHNNFGHSTFNVHLMGADYTTISGLQAANITVDTNNPCSSLHPCNNLASDPLFTNGSGNYSLLSDFNLQSGSPSNGTGRNGADMGANISLVGIKGGGSGDTISPAAPGGLSVN